MVEHRELRDRIEALQAELARVRQHMDKLRSQHAKERDALEAQLQKAQAALREMTDRAEAAEARAEPQAARPASPSLPREPTALLALATPPRDPEDATELIARLTTLSRLDARMRLKSGPPVPLLRLPSADAESLRLALRSQGLTAVALSLPPRAIWPRPVVSAFTLGSSALEVRTEQGSTLEAPYQGMELLMLARRTSARLEVREEVEFDSRGRMTVRQEQTYPVKEEHSLWLFAGPDVRLTFNLRTDFSGLEAQMGLTTADNLRRLTEALSRRAPRAVLDDRLVRGVPVPSLLVAEGDAQEVLAELVLQCVRDFP